MKKNKSQENEKSLLDNPKNETQVKEKPYKIALRVLIILVLSVFMVMSFMLVFSGQTYINFGARKFQGTFNASNYYKTENCSLVVIEEYKSLFDAKEGDVVFFNSATEKGSALFKSYDGNVFELEKENGSVLSINKRFIVGKVSNTVPVVGIFFAYVQSYVCAIVNMVLLFAYLAYISLSRINYENTAYGKRLYAMLKKEEQEKKQIQKIFMLMKSVQGIDQKIVSMLSGSFEENKQKFNEFENDKFTSSSAKYKYILYRVHEVFVPKETLSRKEKRVISSVLELLGESGSVDQDIEYMLVDLLLKGTLVNFDFEEFKEEIESLLENNISSEDILNLGSILYILAVKNPHLDEKIFKHILSVYNKKNAEIGAESAFLAKNLSLSIAKTLK